VLVLALALGLASLAGADDGPPDTNSAAAPEGQLPAQPQAPQPALPDAPPGQVWTTNGELVPIEDLRQPASAAPAAAGATNQAGGARLYYLTDANHATDAVLTACASGYHMASMWEILDPSNLVYDFSHPDAHTKADSGQSAPSLWYGWVRTGTTSSAANTAGIGNCNAWTSAAGGDYGVSVRLTRTWETPPAEVGGVWDATSFSCGLVGPVWCVQD
jgi:hypothetical protein